MKNPILGLALGTTALVLLTSGTSLSDPPIVDDKISQGTSISEIEMEKIPIARDPWAVLNITPGVLADKIENSRSNNTKIMISGNVDRTIRFYDTPRISYDSNICENYNSGTFFLPNNSIYDQRIVDEAMGHIDNLSDNDFLDFMDWLDGYGAPPMVLRSSELGRAMDDVDWMTNAEVDEIFRRTTTRDNDLYFDGPNRLKLSFSGIFAQALVPDQGLTGLGPRFGNQPASGVNISPPTMTLQQGLTEADLTNLKNLFNETGGGVVAPTEKGGNYSAVIPYNIVYGLDRFQIRAEYNYGLDNGITDGSVPTITNNNTPDLSSLGGNPNLEEETSDTYTVGFVAQPNFLPGLNITLDYYNIDITDILKPPTSLEYNPSEYRFHLMNRLGGGMVSIDPPTLDLDAGPSDEPIESIIPELSDPFRIEGHLGQDATDVQFDWETISPRIGLSYDLKSGYSLNFPLGKYDTSITTNENQTTTTESTSQGNIFSSNIKFKIEESIFEGDQSHVVPAEETVVKLGFPIPPMPLEGNPRIDDGASDNPVQGQVDAFGNLNLKYDFKENFGLRLRAEYDYGSLVWPKEDDTQVGDGSPPTLTLIEPETPAGEESDQGWTIDPRMIRLNMEYGGGMTQIDPPSLDLDAGPADEPIESVIPELGPMTGQVSDEPKSSGTTDQQGGDSRLQGRQTDINWNAVQQALGEFADIPAIDRMRDRDLQFEGGDTSPESDTSTGQNTIGNDSPFSWEDISPRIGLNYDLGTPDPVIIRSGIEGTPWDVDLDINMQPIGSKIVYRTDPEADLGGLENFSTRTFNIGKYKLDSLFFPLQFEPQIDNLIGQNEGIARAEPNPYRDKQGDDPYFTSSGSWGQDYADQWAIQRVGFTGDDASAWAAAGDDLAPVIVAVIDTGIDWNHADISWDIIWNNEDEIPGNGIDDDENGYIDDVIGWDFFLNTNQPWDEDGHGTFIAGVIAASSDNEVGISGINPAAKIMVLKALDSFGHTRASFLAEAIVYAVDNGAQIINLSVGGKEISHAEELAVQYAEDNGVLVFAAAGNQGAEVSDYGFVPYETVVAVGSSNIEDKRSGFSNWGEGVDISAPGEDVLSLRARRTDLMLNVRHLEYEMGTAYVGEDNRYYRAAGTSFSTPIVTGIASLILSKNPDLTPTEVRRMLYQSAKDIEVPGRDQYTGFGRVDATAALNADPAFEIVADITGIEVVQEQGGVFITVQGTANANDFEHAQIFIGAGENPDDWKGVGEGISRAVSGGRLTSIAAGEFQGSAVWIIRLVVTHENGKAREERYTLNLN